MSVSSTAFDEPAVEAQLQKILASHTFAARPQLRAFLAFLVSEALTGSSVKESSIGVGFFGRAKGWDSKADTVVRTSASRLRALLGRYYRSEGRRDSCVIRIPKGSYAPIFAFNTGSENDRLGMDVETISQPARRAPSKIIGRDQELETLNARLDKAASGSGGLVCVVAEAGVGKTALVGEFLGKARARERTVVGAGCGYLELEQGDAYGPWRTFLEEWRSSHEAFNELLRQRAPGWWLYLGSDGISAPAFPSVNPKREMLEIIRALARNATVVLFIDDLHWADIASIDVLQYVSFHLATLPVLMIAAYRPSEMRLAQNGFLKVEPELKMRGICEDLAVHDLSMQDSERIVDWRFSPHRFPAEVPSWFFGRTRGNPLCLLAVMDYAVQQGWVRRQSGIWTASGSPSDWPRALPDSVLGWIARILGGIPDADHTLARAAALHGAEFDPAVLAHALKIDGEIVESRIAHMERNHGVFQRLPDAFFNGRLVLRYRFAHPLFQEALLRTVGPAETKRVSLALAEALLELYGPTDSLAATVARLFRAGEAIQRALPFYLQSSMYAVRASAYRQAFELAHCAVALAEEIPPTEDTARIGINCLTVQAMAASTLEGFGASQIEAIYSRAVQISQRLCDRSSSFGVAHAYWGFLGNFNHRRAKELADELQTQADASGQAELMGLARMANGITALQLGEMSDATALLQRGVALWREASPKRDHLQLFMVDPGVVTLMTLARVYCFTGLWQAGHEVCEEGVQRALELQHERTLAYAWALKADVHHLCREVEDAFRIAKEARHKAEQCELPYERVWAMGFGAWALAELGDAEAAVRQFADGPDRYRGPISTKLLCHYAEALGRCGRLPEAFQQLNQALAVVRSLGEPYYEPEILRVRGELILSRRHPTKADQSRAAQCFRDAIDLAARHGSKTLQLRACNSDYRCCQHYDPRSLYAARVRLSVLYQELAPRGDVLDLREAANLLAVDPNP